MDICGSTNCCSSNNSYERFGLSTNVSNEYSRQWSIKVKFFDSKISEKNFSQYLIFPRIRLNYPAISDILSGGDANDVLRCQQEDLVHLGRVRFILDGRQITITEIGLNHQVSISINHLKWNCSFYDFFRLFLVCVLIRLSHFKVIKQSLLSVLILLAEDTARICSI